MGNLKTQNTSYPSQLDTATAIVDGTSGDDITAATLNGPVSAILAIETELGTSVKGTSADLAARLAVLIDGDGGVIRGNDFPVSPPLKPHFFYHNGTKLFYTYDISTASYIAISTVAVLSSYVRKGIADVITAVHSFAPLVTGAPFTLGANAIGQIITGLNADQLDGAHAVTVAAATSIPLSDSSGKIAASWGGNASTLATLDSNIKVVQDPANAQLAGGAGKIPLGDANGKLAASWGGNASTIATLNASSLVVQNPANASATATANYLPIRNATKDLVDRNGDSIYAISGVISGTVGGGSTTTSSWVTVATPSMTVSTGDILFYNFGCNMNSGTSGTGWTAIYMQPSGVATMNARDQITIPNIPVGQTYNLQISGFIYCLGAGTLTVYLQVLTTGVNSSWGSAQYLMGFLKKQ